MKALLKEPLVHFLVVGFGLFILFALVADEESAYDSKVIEVNRETLLTFVQYRTRAFEPNVAARRLDGMSDAELERLINDYVREEALHREAIALRMDKNDYIIKRRMIQSIEFITDGFVTAAVEVSDEEVANYFAANRDDYYIEPYVTFTHVFLDAERHGREQAVKLGQEKLAELNTNAVQFSDATRHGDRFPFFVNYVERGPEFVASHFGATMAQGIFDLEPSDATWHGPFESEYGAHLVLLTRKAEGRYPELDEVAAAVRDDAVREARAAKKDEAVQAIVDTYEVRNSFRRQATGAVR